MESEVESPVGRIRVRTAWRWLNKLEMEYAEVKKGGYVDGHER